MGEPERIYESLMAAAEGPTVGRNLMARYDGQQCPDCGAGWGQGHRPRCPLWRKS